MRVLVGTHPKRDALVNRIARQPVELGQPGLEDRDPRIGCQLHGFRDAFVLLRPARDVEGHCRNPRPQRLHDGVAARDHLRSLAAAPGRQVLAAGRLMLPG